MIPSPIICRSGLPSISSIHWPEDLSWSPLPVLDKLFTSSPLYKISSLGFLSLFISTYKMKMKKSTQLFSFLILSLSLGPEPGLVRSSQTEPNSTGLFDVGVILDMGTWVGNLSWSCIRMALDDFYAAHPDFATRLVLHPRNSQEDVVSAASGGMRLHASLFPLYMLETIKGLTWFH